MPVHFNIIFLGNADSVTFFDSFQSFDYALAQWLLNYDAPQIHSFGYVLEAAILEICIKS